jgi:hypothetical protein
VTPKKLFLLHRQIIGLAKIAAFCKDQSLHEFRQREMREQCLKFWKIPDTVRKAPIMDNPQVDFYFAVCAKLHS